MRHITLPFAITNQAIPEPGETIGAFLTRTQWATPLPPARRRAAARYGFRLPTICVVNGQPVRQREWKRRRIKVADQVEFWSRPWGGSSGSGGPSGKQIAGIVALIAIAVLAPYLVGPAGLGLAAGTFGFNAAVAAITVGGGLLVSALTRPNPGGQSADPTSQVEQLYSVAAQGNTTRLLQPLTVQYGRIKSFPDFAISPWSEFSGNDQYLNVLLAPSLGSLEYEALYIDDTILWTLADGYSTSFTGVEARFYEPNATVDLFPTNVTQSGEVAGQDITQTPVGGFVANASGSTAMGIAVDLVFPSGCFNTNVESGNTVSASVTVTVEARTVNDAGAPTGAYAPIGSETFTYTTRNPQRATIKIDVSPARYEVRVSRTDAPLSSDRGANDVVWAGLRAFIEGPSSFPVSTIAIRIKANSQLTAASARKFGLVATRKLMVWDPDTETLTPQATRNPFWAAYDAATDQTYGCARPPSKIDFQSVVDLANAADARGDTFDFRFTSAVQAPVALDTCLKPARSRHRWSGDVLTFVRDEWPAGGLPRMLLTDREIARGSLSIDYILNPDNAADAVTLEYADQETWGPAEIQYPQNSIDFTAINPGRIQIDGIVDREHAHREAAFYYLQSQLRRINVSLDTEHDGRMLGFGSRVRVQTELPQSWGSSGAVVSNASGTLLVSPAPTWGADPHYIAIRTKTGRQFGPVLCTQGVDTAHIVLDAGDLSAVQTAQGMTLAQALDRADGADDPSFDFGPGTRRARDCMVITGRPSKDRVTLALVVDNEAVHTTDLTEAPNRPTLPSLTDARTPIVIGLYAQFTQGVAEPMLDASWIPASGAQYYIALVSYDGGATRQQIYEGIAPRLDRIPVDRAALRLYVQGVGVRHGPYATADLDAPVIVIAPGTVASSSLIAGLHERVTTLLKEVSDKNDRISQFIASYMGDQDAHNFLEKVQSKQRDGTLKTLIDDVTGDLNGIGARVTIAEDTLVTDHSAFAGLVSDLTTNYATSDTTAAARSFTEQTALSTAESAVATYDQGVSSSFGGLSATATASFDAVTTISGHLAGSIAFTLNVNGLIGGQKLLSDGSVINAAFAVDNFSIGTPGLASKAVFSVGTVGGVASVVINGSLQADGSIVARNMAAGSIAAGNIIVDDILVTGHLRADAATSLTFATVAGYASFVFNPAFNVVSATATVGRVLVAVTLEMNGAMSSMPLVYLRVNNTRIKGFFCTVPHSINPAGTDIIPSSSGATTTFTFPVTVGVGSNVYGVELANNISSFISMANITISVLESRR